MHSSPIAQYDDDLVRAAQRNPVLARALRPLDDPQPRHGPVALPPRRLAEAVVRSVANKVGSLSRRGAELIPREQ